MTFVYEAQPASRLDCLSTESLATSMSDSNGLEQLMRGGVHLACFTRTKNLSRPVSCVFSLDLTLSIHIFKFVSV